MNYFFAIEVPSEARQFIQNEVVSLWKPALRESTGWYAPEDYHITLKFLGNTTEKRQQSLILAATSIAAQASPFTITLAPPGAFPSHRSKRIFWMGVGRNQGIVSLADALDRMCEGLGFKREDRLYTPHITVARTPRGRGRESDGNAPTIGERTFPFWEATRFVLMQTLPQEQRINGAKARYNTVQTFPFGDAHS